MGVGDEIMVTGMARRLQERNPLPVRVLTQRGKARWHEIWDGNPRMAPLDFAGPVQTLKNGPGRRPYIEGETRERWLWRDWECPVGELFLTDQERAFGARYPGRVILEPTIKQQASPNKDWGWGRWSLLASELLRRGYPVAQLGAAGTPVLDGVELIVTPGFREAASVLGASKLAILPEGGLHHAAAALGTPAIVIFGGYISPRQTGYATQTNLFVGRRGCGMRTRCQHCAEAMSAIRPEQIVEQVPTLAG